MSSSLSSLLHLQGLPPLPRSLSGYGTSANTSGQQQQPHPVGPTQIHGSPQHFPSSSSHAFATKNHRPSPIPPPRPHSRRSSSSGSSFRASPEHVTNRIIGVPEPLRSSPRSLSSSPHSPHIDSGLGRSSAESFSEPRAFVRVIKSPPGGTKWDAQLSQLKRDMQHLRQQDMALLGHLLQINQGIQDLKNVLVPPPQPAPSSMAMFHSNPIGYASPGSYGNPPPPRHSRKLHQSSHLYKGAKMFAARASMESDLGAVGGLREKDEDSDSLSSLEFGDV